MDTVRDTGRSCYSAARWGKPVLQRLQMMDVFFNQKNMETRQRLETYRENPLSPDLLERHKKNFVSASLAPM